jgi:hypothetical protein
MTGGTRPDVFFLEILNLTAWLRFSHGKTSTQTRFNPMSAIEVVVKG